MTASEETTRQRYPRFCFTCTICAARKGNLTYGWDANKNKTSEGISGTLSGYDFAVGGSGYAEEDRLFNKERSDNNIDQAWNFIFVGD